MLTPMPETTWSCLSTDAKPTPGSEAWEFGGMALHNGQALLELDTGKVYVFDEAGGEWREI